VYSRDLKSKPFNGVHYEAQKDAEKADDERREIRHESAKFFPVKDIQFNVYEVLEIDGDKISSTLLSFLWLHVLD